jgi:hypothetical protein
LPHRTAREALNKPLFSASFIGVGGGIPELVQTFPRAALPSTDRAA